MIYTLKKTIPSHSHNAPFTAELGNHWPTGQRFKKLPKYRQTYYGSTIFEQIGGEEVLLLVQSTMVEELFGREP